MEQRTKNRSITLRLVSTVIVVVVILNILSVIGTLGFFSVFRKNIYQEHSYALQLYMNQLDRELGQAQSRMYELCDSRTFRIAMDKEHKLADSYMMFRSQTELFETFNDWLSQFPMTDGYFILQPETGLLIISGDDSAFTLSLSRFLNDQPVSADGRWMLQELNDTEYLSFISSHHGTIYGAWVQENRLMEEWGIDRASRDRYRLVSETGISSGDVVSVSSEQADCALQYLLPPSETMLPAGILILMIASVVMLFAIPFVWMIMRRLVLRPVNELIGAIRHIESGDVDYRIPEKSTSREFDKLNVQFNNSMDQLANMRMQVYESRLERERIYINYLSQQMQPHFVLNTLNLIFSMEPDEYDLIMDTVTCLSDYYRYIAHVQDQLVPVQAEISHVENYFKLQQIRYPEMFFYRIDCPDELKKAMIPPIIIQTFAENAIKHSLIVGQSNSVEILVEQCTRGDGEPPVLHIVIRDHGKGYPEEILAKIRRFRETGEHQEGLGLGIQNTIERLQLIYQDRAQILLDNAADGGAMVELYLPVEMEPDLPGS